MRPPTAEEYYSADCRFGGCGDCTEGEPPTRVVEELVYLVCACGCHASLEQREAAMRTAGQQRRE
ncbi:hypothetical protein GCM10010420_47900 [Streptomyces glaucosporus]|uniref:Uncharacterized protein n=1 Tax=Streptomyces glaucosporus TaxID=284044 RepID=A0ABP5VVJ7_9ACTN